MTAVNAYTFFTHPYPTMCSHPNPHYVHTPSPSLCAHTLTLTMCTHPHPHYVHTPSPSLCAHTLTLTMCTHPHPHYVLTPSLCAHTLILTMCTHHQAYFFEDDSDGQQILTSNEHITPLLPHGSSAPTIHVHLWTGYLSVVEAILVVSDHMIWQEHVT